MALNKKSLLNRVLVGIAIFIVMAGMILLNIFLPNYTNDETHMDIYISGRAINSVIISVVILLSIVEMRRALGTERIPHCFSWLIWLYGIGLMPVYSLFGFMGIMFFSLIVFIASVLTGMFKNRTDSLIYIAFMLVYPGLFMATLLYLNRSAATRSFEGTAMYPYLETDIWRILNQWLHTGREETNLLPLNALALALVFSVSTLTDTFAYFVGSLFGKHKLCPDISPKKTVEGAIGGIFGGMLGSAIVYFIFDFSHFFGYGAQFGLTFEGLGLKWYFVLITYLLIGIFGSAATQIGDLLASMVKRYCGIKDYSRLLGEHGGIIDRMDGIMFNSVFVAFVFMFIL